MVECTALEMRHTREGIQGSNPCLSANTSKSGLTPYILEMTRLSLTDLLHKDATQGVSDMADPPGLARRGNSWFIRRRVPEHLKPIIGRTEITKTLKTTSHREAKLRAWEALSAIAKRFEWAEIALRQAEITLLFNHAAVGPTEDEIDGAAFQFLQELEADAHKMPQDPGRAGGDEADYGRG